MSGGFTIIFEGKYFENIFFSYSKLEGFGKKFCLQKKASIIFDLLMKLVLILQYFSNYFEIKVRDQY